MKTTKKHNHRCINRCDLTEFECNNLCYMIDDMLLSTTHECVKGTYRCDGTLDVDSCVQRQSMMKLTRNCRYVNTAYSQHLIRHTRNACVGKYNRDAVFTLFKSYHETELLRTHISHLNMSHLFPSLFNKPYLVRPYDRRLEFMKTLFRPDYVNLDRNLKIHWYFYLNAGE